VGHDIGRVTGVAPLTFLEPSLFSPHLFGNPIPIALDQVSKGDISLYPGAAHTRGLGCRLDNAGIHPLTLAGQILLVKSL
jgi:hypothetical protein